MTEGSMHPDIREDNVPFGCGWMGTETGEDPRRCVEIRSLEAEDFGTWRVRVRTEGEGMLFSQRRNFVGPVSGETETGFYTCLTEYIPSMSSRISRDKRLFCSAAGARITRMEAERAEVRRVFIAGDSTVADQSARMPWYPADCYCGWGQVLPMLLKEDAVCNQAHSGMTTRCFAEDGHLEIVLRYLQKGDLVLMQFGHNDQKRRELQAFGGYTDRLRALCGAVRKKGGVPVLISPVSRVPSRDAAGPFDLLQRHAEAVKALAEREGIPFIDLHEYTYRLYLETGEGCRVMFKPGDATHGSDRGGYSLACRVAAELNRMGLAMAYLPEMEPYFVSDKERYPYGVPTGDPLPVPYVDLNRACDPAVLSRALKRGLLDPCVLHMHPEAPLPKGQFIQLLMRAAGVRGEPTDGADPFRDVSARDWDGAYAAACKKRSWITGNYYHPDEDTSRTEARRLCAAAGYPAVFRDGPELLTRYEIIEALTEAEKE